MIFGDLILASIIGCSAYLQAERGGWRNLILTLVLFALALGGLLAWMGPGDQAGALMQGPDRLRGIAVIMLPVGLGFAALGALAGKLLAGRLTPERAGIAAFVGGYVAINIFSLVF